MLKTVCTMVLSAIIVFTLCAEDGEEDRTEDDCCDSEILELSFSTFDEERFDKGFTENLKFLEEVLPSLGSISTMWDDYEPPKLFSVIYSEVGAFYGNDMEEFKSVFSSLEKNIPSDQEEIFHSELELASRALTFHMSVIHIVSTGIEKFAKSLYAIEQEWDPEWGTKPRIAQKFSACAESATETEKQETSAGFITLTEELQAKSKFFSKAKSPNSDFSNKIATDIVHIYHDTRETLSKIQSRFRRDSNECFDNVDLNPIVNHLEQEMKNEN